MILQTIDSGSQGNCHILTADNGDIFIIELGVQEKLIKRAIDFRIGNVAACFCSHVHSDHHKSVEKFKSMGIPVFEPYNSKWMKKEWEDFKCKAFPLVHDVPCYGLYLEHPEIGNLLYICDTAYCAYDFSALKVRHLMIEANYQTDMVDMDSPNFEHKIRHHQSIDTAESFIKHNNSPELRSVVLIHSNPTTIDETDAIRQIKGIVDSDVEVAFAHAGLEMELRKGVL